MNFIKSLATVIILAAVGVGLYVKINNMPDPVPPQDFSGTWGTPPEIEMGESDSPAMIGNLAIPAAPSAFPPAQHATPAAVATTHDYPLPTPAVDARAAHVDPFVKPSANYAQPGMPASGAVTAGTEATAMAATGGGSFESDWANAQQAIAQGKLDDALQLLTAWYQQPQIDPTQQRDLENLLSQLAGSVIYSSEYHLEPEYVVQGSETLGDVARQYQVSPELLANINGLVPHALLEPGQRLKVVRGPFDAFVSWEQREITLLLNGRYAGRFIFSIGIDCPHVLGQYRVGDKIENPTYYGKDRVVQADDPGNPLGEHWLGLNLEGQSSGNPPLGIHGSTPSTNSSGGYISLSPQDAKDAFAILNVGSRVIFRK